MRAWTLILLALLLGACTNTPPIPPPVNTQVTEHIDVTGDGQPETITLVIKAAHSHAPVQWLLTIDSGGMTIFDRDGDDTEVDALFDDREALPGCADYLACKNQYYFQAMLGNLVDREWDPDDILDMRRGGKLPPLVYSSLEQCCSITGPRAETIVADMERRLKERKAILIRPPVSPTESAARMIYSPEVGQFIEIEAP